MSKKTTDANAPAEQFAGEKKGKKVIKIILNTIINILIVLVLIVSLLIAVMALTSKETGISTIFGYTIQTIQSNSMKGGSPDGYGGGDFEKGDLIIGKSTNFNSDAEYQIGDIVTQRIKGDNDVYYFLAHRIVEKEKAGESTYSYRTQGDNRDPDDEDHSMVPDEQIVFSKDIGSVLYNKDYDCIKIKGLGGFLDSLKTDKLYFFLIILLPMIVFFLYALIRVVLSATSFKKAQAQEFKEEAEKEKQEAVDAAVKAALAAKGGEDANPADTPADMTPEQMEQFKQFLAFQKAQQSAETPESPAEEAAESTKE